MKEVNQGINVLKFIAVVSVILIHETFPGMAGIVAKGAAAMSVPVFFMVSGYYSYGAESGRIKKRALKIFKLMLIANFIYFVWDIAVEFLSGGSVRLWLRGNCSLKRLLVFILTNESPLRGHLWFLGALLYSYLFMIIFDAYAKKGRGRLAGTVAGNSISCLLVLSVLLLALNIAGGEFLTLYGKNIQIPYIRNWLFMGIPFFNIAYCIHAKEKRIYERISLDRLPLLLLVAIVLNIMEVWIMPQSGLYITTVFVNIITFLLALGYARPRSALLAKLGSLADKYGLWVYILQIIVIKNLRWFYEKNGISDMLIVQWLSPFAALILSFAAAAVAVWLINAVKSERKRADV